MTWREALKAYAEEHSCSIGGARLSPAFEKGFRLGWHDSKLAARSFHLFRDRGLVGRGYRAAQNFRQSRVNT